MDLNQYIKGLKSTDLELSKEWVIRNFFEEVFEDEKKPGVELEFKGVVKILTLNLTNLKAIIECFGSKSEENIGKILVLKSVLVDFKGKSYESVRVDIEETKKKNEG